MLSSAEGLGLTLGPQPSRRWPSRVAAALVCAVAVLGVGYVIGRGHSLSSGAVAGVAAGPGSPPVLSWAVDGPWPVPRSAAEGPTRLSGGSTGVPLGYAHDGLGAALAAFNISEQLTSDVGPVVAAVTARTQTYGDPAATLRMVESTPTGGSTPPTELLYKVIGGDPGSDRVVLALGQRTVESSAAGGFWVTDREMRWLNGDWRMALPVPGAVIAQRLPGYVSLGGPPHV
jgi:hypothetical protein